MKTKAETARWSRLYRTVLCRYLKRKASTGLRPMQKLGREAAALGLETLDLALVHEQALTAIVASCDSGETRQRLVNRAKRFFAETIAPIEKTHDAARKADVRVNRLNLALSRRTVESAESARSLKWTIGKRQKAEAALKESGKNRTQLVKRSNSLNALLRDQTRKTLLAQETERLKTSLQLQNEVAQALLAIDIKLLALKTSVKTTTEKFSKEIANTQRMVRTSLKTVKGVRL